MSAKTIKINKHTRNLIETYREDGETIDDCVVRLLKSTEPLRKIDWSKTNINLKESTLKNLIGYKAYPTQSHSDTLMELLEQVLKEE